MKNVAASFTSAPDFGARHRFIALATLVASAACGSGVSSEPARGEEGSAGTDRAGAGGAGGAGGALAGAAGAGVTGAGMAGAATEIDSGSGEAAAIDDEGGRCPVDASTPDCSRPAAGPPLKRRVVLLTDIAPENLEADDAMTMVRFLVHADLFEIEGLVATAGWNSSYGPYSSSWADRIPKTIDAYEKDSPNLLKRSSQIGFLADESRQTLGYWPSPAYLRSRFVMGSLKLGVAQLGENNDSDGSKLIIKLADEDDPRPLWVLTGGGDNTLAQALWRVQKDRTPAQLQAFLAKIRTYTIYDQDMPFLDRMNYAFSSHPWMRKQFGKNLFFVYDQCACDFQNTTGVKNWSDYVKYIQNQSNLGRMYPHYSAGVEGDTPDFLYVMPTGLNNPEVPNQASWGGYFEYGLTVDGMTTAWINQAGTRANTTCNKYEAYFYPAEFNNFAARMEWAQNGKGNRNPVVIVNDNEGYEVITMKPKAGTQVVLDASKTYDPDGDKLTFKWWILPEAGTYTQNFNLPTDSANKTTIDLPVDSAGKSIHVICEVTDDGAHTLVGYRRIVLEPI